MERGFVDVRSVISQGRLDLFQRVVAVIRLTHRVSRDIALRVQCL